MTPPFDRLRGHTALTLPDGLDHFSLEGTQLIHPGPSLGETTSLHQRFFGLQGLQELAQLTGSEQPDPNLLPQAIQEGLAHARDGNPASYLMVLRMIAAMVVMVEDADQQEQFRTVGRQVASEAMEAIQGSDLNSRDQVRRLYDIALVAGNILARPTGGALPEEDQQLMQQIFTAIQQGIEHNRAAATEGSGIDPLPEYLESFTTAQLAMLSGHSEDAIRALLHTREILNALPTPRVRGGVRDQIALSTELALQSLPRDSSGVYADSFQTRLSYELLSYLFQVDYLQEHGEDAAGEAQRISQQFNLISGLAAEYDLRPNEESGEFSETDVAFLTQTLDTLYAGNENFRHAVEAWNLEHMDNKEERDESWHTVIETAQTVFAHIHAHRDAEPYHSVLTHEASHHRIAQAAEILNSHAPLTHALTDILMVAEDSPHDLIVRELVEYGPMLPMLLESLPQEIRENHDYEAFFDQIRGLAQGFRGEGLEHNLTDPTRELMQSVENLSHEHDAYQPAFSAFFHSLSEIEEVLPGVEFPRELHNRAASEAGALDEVNWGSAMRHVFMSPESIAMIIGGSVLAELGSAWLLGGARIPFLRSAETAAQIRTTGTLAGLVRGGALTWRGEMVVGFGVSLGMSLASGTVHCATSDRPFFEEAGRILPGLALGTLISGFAMAGTMAASFGLRRTLLSEARISSPWARGGLQRLANIGLGGGLMLGAGSVTRGLMGGGWERPTQQETAEMFLTMAAWDMSSLGLRTMGNHLWWRSQLGPHRAHQVEQMVSQVRRVNPEIDVNFLRNYLGMRVSSGSTLQDLRRALRAGEVPVLEGEGRGRRFVFRRTGAPESPLVQQILQSSEFNDLMESIQREVVVRLTASSETEAVWVQVQRNEGTLQFHIQRADVAGNPATMFRVGPDGVPIGLEGLTDAIVRQVLSEYGQELRVSGRAAMRQGQFEKLPRRRATPSRRLGSTAAVPPPPPVAPRPAAPESTTAPEACPEPELTRTQRAMVGLISESPEYSDALAALRRDVQTRLSTLSGETQVWVRATRSGESVRFQIFTDEPGAASDTACRFKMNAQGQITDLSGGEPILKSLIEQLPRIPNPIPPSLSEEDVEEIDEDEREEVADIAEAARPGVTEESLTLRPARVPAEARRIPPALSPSEGRPAAPSSSAAEGEPSDTFARRIRARARSLPSPADPDSTLGLDRSDLVRLEGQRNNYERLMQELDKLATHLEGLQGASDDPYVFIEIDPSAEDWFNVIRPVEIRRHASRGYFVLRMVPGGVSGTGMPRLEGDPFTDSVDLGFGIRERGAGGVARDLSLAEILRDLFAR